VNRGFAKAEPHEEETGMDRSQKAEAVAELNRTFGEVSVVVVNRNLGMTVKQSTDLRNKMRDAGASYRVSKNKLAKIAIEGTDYAGLSDLLTGPTALATSADPVAAAKVITDFAKTNDKIEIVGGAMLVAPATKLAIVTQAPAAQIARVLSAYAEKEAA
jgi:large subunit ribosomal protein L10